MARISTYEQNRIISQQTNVAPVDNSGLKFSNTIANAAEQAATIGNAVANRNYAATQQIGQELLGNFAYGLRIRQYSANQKAAHAKEMADHVAAAYHSMKLSELASATSIGIDNAFKSAPYGAAEVERDAIRNDLQKYMKTNNMSPEVRAKVVAGQYADLEARFKSRKDWESDREIDLAKAQTAEARTLFPDRAGAAQSLSEYMKLIDEAKGWDSQFAITELPGEVGKNNAQMNKQMASNFLDSYVARNPEAAKALLQSVVSGKAPKPVADAIRGGADDNEMRKQLDRADKYIAANESARLADIKKADYATTLGVLDAFNKTPNYNIKANRSLILKNVDAFDKVLTEEASRPIESRNPELAKLVGIKKHELEGYLKKADAEEEHIKALQKQGVRDAEHAANLVKQKLHEEAVAKTKTPEAQQALIDVQSASTLLTKHMQGDEPTATAREAESVLLANEVAKGAGLWYGREARYQAIQQDAIAKKAMLDDATDSDGSKTALEGFWDWATGKSQTAAPQAQATPEYLDRLASAAVGAKASFVRDYGRAPKTPRDFAITRRRAELALNAPKKPQYAAPQAVQKEGSKLNRPPAPDMNAAAEAVKQFPQLGGISE